MMNHQLPLIQLRHSDPLPPVHVAWGPETAAPGLLALGGGLSVERLFEAYTQGCFPWYSDGQPVMWWSPDPRMVLVTDEFRLHLSLRKHIKQLINKNKLEIRINHDFRQIIQHCASSNRKGQMGTWIVDDMVEAYAQFHQAGFAHSVETWIDGELKGGLYCVAIGKAVYGESMFALQANASKIALAALICICKAERIKMIDCQQYTTHLASLGAQNMQRSNFMEHISFAKHLPPANWAFKPLYWNELMPDVLHP